jgi:hypothetical protein
MPIYLLRVTGTDWLGVFIERVAKKPFQHALQGIIRRTLHGGPRASRGAPPDEDEDFEEAEDVADGTIDEAHLWIGRLNLDT